MMDRESALALLKEQQPDAYLMQHSLNSEAIMRALAEKLGQDADLWATCGLLHDLDFMCTKDDPAQHGRLAASMLEGRVTAEAIHAILAHNSEYSGTQPETDLDWALRCAETVTGLISAAALVRPDGMQGMQSKSIKKKMKDKSFAAAVSRENVKECEKLGLSLDDFLSLSIEAMTKV